MKTIFVDGNLVVVDKICFVSKLKEIRISSDCPSMDMIHKMKYSFTIYSEGCNLEILRNFRLYNDKSFNEHSQKMQKEIKSIYNDLVFKL